MSDNTFTSAHVDFDSGVAVAVTVDADTGTVDKVDEVELPDEARDPSAEREGFAKY